MIPEMSIAARALHKRKIRALPITGNYLERDSSGQLHWAQENDQWSTHAPVGGQRQIITNIRRDNTPHSTDLWLYSNLTKDENNDRSNVIDDLMEQNRITLDRSRKWYIRQFYEVDRPGIVRFGGLPLTQFMKIWRQPLDLERLDFFGLSNRQVKFVYGNVVFNLFVKWPEMTKDLGESQGRNYFTMYGKTKVYKSAKVMPWLWRHCRGGFVPFTDQESHFLDFEEEVLYITDVAGILT